MNLTLKQLRIFVSVAQEHSITAAAEKLFLTKPAVSMALSQLELQLEHKLFDRANNRLLLNEQGRQLLPLADELLSRANEIDQLFTRSGPLTGTLRLGSSNTVGNQLTPFLLRDFGNRHGHQRQSLTISNTTTICRKLCEFELDAALVEGKVEEPDLVVKPWLTDNMVVVSAPDSPLMDREIIYPADLESSRWILRESGSGSRAFFLDKVAARLHHWEMGFELTSTEAIINCTAAGLGLACISQLAALRAVNDGRIAILPLSLKMERTYQLVYHKEKYLSPLLRTFFEFCQQWQPPSLNYSRPES